MQVNTTSIKAEKEERSTLYQILALTVLIVLILVLSLDNFLMFHTSIELFSVIIGTISLIIAINTYKYNINNSSFMFMGIAYGFIALFDFLHTLSYPGMNIFIYNNPNIPTQLWIAARYIESISLMVACIAIDKKINLRKATLVYFAVSILILTSLLYLKVFPACYIEGRGLTFFKKISEYVICSFLIVGIIFLIRNKEKIQYNVLYFMILSLSTTIISELFFTFYSSAYDIRNILGHIFKLLSFLFMYKALVKVSLITPYDELVKSERRYHHVLELLPLAVFVYVDGIILYANEAAKDILGAEEYNEIIGKNIKDFFPTCCKNSNSERCIKADKVKKVFFSAKEKLKKLDGTIIEVEKTAATYTYNNKPAVLTVVRDLSLLEKVEKLESKIERDEKLLAETREHDRIKTAFFSNLSHELKTPINVILGSVQLAHLNLNNQKEDSRILNLKKHLRIIKQNSYRLLKIVNNLIDITKIDSGYFQVNLKNHNIVYIVENIVESISDYIKSKGITLLFDTNTEEKYIACDPDKIERIILNLLSNAIKFTDPGGNITVEVSDKKDNVVISVKDTGIGIPKEKINTIFQRFSQVEQSLTRNREGSGIGLSLVKSLVEMHGGNINVKSQVGKGSEFIITLPSRLVEENDITVNSTDQQTQVERINIEFSDIYSETC